MRAYASPDDLQRMQDVAVACGRADGDLAHPTAGDLVWWLYQHRNKLDEVEIRLWEDERGLAAWAWIWLEPRLLVLQVRPDARGAELVGEVLDWAEAEVPGVAAIAVDRDPFLPDVLRGRGWLESDDGRMDHLVRKLGGLPEPEVPDGYMLRHVELPADVHERAEVHRQAFAPSRVVDTMYWVVSRTWPYRAELDWVAEAQDGTFAAFCLAWLDEANGVAEMEPVGTHPEHRRRGLGSAVCLAALRAARDAGARSGLVYAVTGSEGAALYESLGFTRLAQHVRFRKAR